MKKVDTIIISDLHLGIASTRAGKCLKTLKGYSFKRLILLGDIFESVGLTNLKDSHWELVTYFHDISRTREVIWVEGNHDQGLSKAISSLMGIRVRKYYIWKYQGKKNLAIHGHQFDSFLLDNYILSFITTVVYFFIRRLESRNQPITGYIKKNSRGWLRLSNQVARNAILFGRLKKADNIFCGHTHQALEIRKGKTRYFNSGCWTDIPSTFITLDKEGIKLNNVY